jgi:hypothetical protein
LSWGAMVPAADGVALNKAMAKATASVWWFAGTT